MINKIHLINHVLHLFTCSALQGWVPRKELSSELIEFPQKVFYVGQMVKCHVVHVSPEEDRLILSLRVRLPYVLVTFTSFLI